MQLGIYQGEFGEKVFDVEPDKHTAIFGKSGTGKSTLLRNMILEDVRHGRGVTVLDPHGDLADSLLNSIPSKRTRDVIWFDPASDFPVGLNIIDGKNEHRAVESVTTIISTVWPAGWGPQSDFLCTNALRAVLRHNPRATILSLHKFIVDARFRKTAFLKCDGDLKDFQRVVDTDWDKRQREQAFAPLLNKVSKFVSNPILRTVTGQQSTIHFRDVIKEKKILLCRLSKGALGSDVSSLLGSVIVTKLITAAMEQESIPWEKRVPHSLYLDEVQSFTKGIPLDVILAEARKYRLFLTPATQTVSQLPEGSEQAVFGNCSTLICYRVSGEDAKTLALEFGDEFPASALLKLRNFEFYGKTVLGGIPVEPEKVLALAPIKFPANEPDKVRRWSEENYGTPRAEVDKRLTKFLGS